MCDRIGHPIIFCNTDSTIESIEKYGQWMKAELRIPTLENVRFLHGMEEVPPQPTEQPEKQPTSTASDNQRNMGRNARNTLRIVKHTMKVTNGKVSGNGAIRKKVTPKAAEPRVEVIFSHSIDQLLDQSSSRSPGQQSTQSIKISTSGL